MMRYFVSRRVVVCLSILVSVSRQSAHACVVRMYIRISFSCNKFYTFSVNPLCLYKCKNISKSSYVIAEGNILINI